jgi:CRISPR/Cas system CMR-associated protein Cmr1 (group 7 of RAMP superfamily)
MYYRREMQNRENDARNSFEIMIGKFNNSKIKTLKDIFINIVGICTCDYSLEHLRDKRKSQYLIVHLNDSN